MECLAFDVYGSVTVHGRIKIKTVNVVDEEIHIASSNVEDLVVEDCWFVDGAVVDASEDRVMIRVGNGYCNSR